MYISVYHNEARAGYYREQKSTCDWDYSVNPPVPLSVDKQAWFPSFFDPRLACDSVPGYLIFEILHIKEVFMTKKWWLSIALGLALILVLPVMSGCSSTAAAQDAAADVVVSQQPQGIWVTGTGELAVTPDICTISLGIIAQETTVAEAQAKAAEAMAEVMQALTDSGIAAKDIQRFFQHQPATRWDDLKQMEAVTGYRVTNMVTVKIRNAAQADAEVPALSDKAGTVIDSVVQAGGDLIRINGIDFSVEEPSQYYEEVRKKAMATAKNKAEELAELAGVTLGNPTYIAENAQYSPVYGGYSNFSISVQSAAPAPVVDTSISSGEATISLSVQVTYSIAK
jgi:uncharacterized protein YggE